jgi:protein-S-isoprenylcysteine O-methyltransferase Ste14
MNNLLQLFYRGLFPVIWSSFIAYWLVSAFWVRKTKVSEPPASRILRLLAVSSAIALFAFDRFGLLDKQLWPQNALTFWSGAAVTLAGVAFAVWARIHLGRLWSGAITLKDGHRLIRSGPYQIVRNPIYTGILTGLAGTAIALGKPRGLLALAILFAVYSWKIRLEERLLASEFGDEYVRYCDEVPALVPFLF